MAGFTEGLENHAIKTRVTLCPPNHEDFGALMWHRAPYAKQGAILLVESLARASNPHTEPLLQWLRGHSVPFVLLCFDQFDVSCLPEHHRVCINKTWGFFQSARHLIELGHRRIGFVGGLPGHGIPTPQYDGYAAAMTASGLGVPAECLLHVLTEDPVGAEGGFRGFLDRPDRPEAVVARNDATAVATVRAAQSLGLRVPEDLSVVGYNDEPLARQCAPPLTTVAVPRRQAGRAAVEMLLHAAENPQKGFLFKMFECSLVARGSTAQAKA